MDSLSIQMVSETCTIFTQPTLNVGEYDNTLIDTSTAPTCFVFALNPAHHYITGKSFNILSWAIGTVCYFHRTDNLKNHFNELVSEWHEQRGFASSVSDIISCAAYQEIIKLGSEALPLIFERLQIEKDDPDFWFVALAEITGANPVKSENRGNMKKMAQDWLSWNQNDQCIRENALSFS